MSFSQYKPSSGGDKARVGDGLDILAWKDYDKKWITCRFVPLAKSIASCWVDVITKNGDKKSVNVVSMNYNSETDDFDDRKCPYQEAGFAPFRKQYYCNAILRELQDEEPKKKAKHTKSERKRIKEGGLKFFPKESGSKSWTPVRVVRVSPTLMARLQSFKDLNRVKSKDGEVRNVDIDHIKFGCDVKIMYDSSQSGSGMYNVQKEARTPLTEEELDYLYYALEESVRPQETLEEAKKNAASLAKIAATGDDEEDEKPKKKKSKGKPVDDDDDDDDDSIDYEDEDEDEDEEKAPKKSKKSKKKSKDDDDDDDDYDDDFDEDDESNDDEEESDDDDDDDDDEDEEPKKKKSKKSKKSKKKSKDDDDEDFDF